MTDPDFAVLDDLMIAFMRQHDIEAGTLAVMNSETLLHERGYGWQDPEQQQPLPPDALMRIASISKPLTNAAIRKLVAEGHMELTDRVFCVADTQARCWLPVGDTDPADLRLADINVQHLLDHRGGWDREISGDVMFQSLAIAKALAIPSPPSKADITRYVVGQPLDFAPGSHVAYSNFGYSLLGQIIERATNQSYIDYLNEAILNPIGVTDVAVGRTLPENRHPREPWYADPGYATSVFTPSMQVSLPDGGFYVEAMDSHGGLIASAADLVRFGQAYRFDGHPIPQNPCVGYQYGSGAAYGSLAGTHTMLSWNTNGLTMAVLFNQRVRKDGTLIPMGDLTEQLRAALNEVDLPDPCSATLTPTASNTPTATATATPTPTSIPPDALVVNFETGAPGSVFVFTAPNLPAGARVQVAVQRPGGSAFSTLRTLTVPDGGTLVFVLVTDDSTPLGSYTIRIRTEQAQRGLVQTIERTTSFTLATDAPTRTERPTDPAVPELSLVQRVYLPLIVRGR
ncbi:serine hydrolase [bacterium]|nr:serine hydrolase [bacterium]